MKNFVQTGQVLHYTPAAGSNIKSGDLVAVGSVVGVAVTDGVVGKLLAVSVTGVYNIPVPSTVAAITQGQAVYFNTTSKEITLTASGNVLAGYAWDAATASGVVPIRLIF